MIPPNHDQSTAMNSPRMLRCRPPAPRMLQCLPSAQECCDAFPLPPECCDAFPLAPECYDAFPLSSECNERGGIVISVSVFLLRHIKGGFSLNLYFPLLLILASLPLLHHRTSTHLASKSADLVSVLFLMFMYPTPCVPSNISCKVI